MVLGVRAWVHGVATLCIQRQHEDLRRTLTLTRTCELSNAERSTSRPTHGGRGSRPSHGQPFQRGLQQAAGSSPRWSSRASMMTRLVESRK